MGLPVLQRNEITPFLVSHIPVKPELWSNNGFSSLIRGAGTLGSCPAEPDNAETNLSAVTEEPAGMSLPVPLFLMGCELRRLRVKGVGRGAI
jgi:hypothetical protein